MKHFKVTHKIFGTVREFSEDDAPDWITSKNTVRGSTMDGRWFWEGYVLKMEVGGTLETDFQAIERIS